MKNEDEDHVFWAYFVLGFAVCSLISFNVPLGW